MQAWWGIGKFTRSLTTRMMLFLLALSVPILFVVEFAVLSFEYLEISSKLKAGALQTQVEGFATAWRADPPDEKSAALRLENIRLQLHDLHSPWLGNPYALVEFASAPISVQLKSNPQDQPREIGHWHAAAPVPMPGNQLKSLSLELQLLPPWRRASTAFSVEWPLMLCCLVLLGLGAEFFMRRFVVKRLDRIALSAENWRKEEFSDVLEDESADEIGVLSRRLNSVAIALRFHLEERERRAGQAERERLARDLHDSVKQHGFALEMQLGALQYALPAEVPNSANPARVALSEAQALSAQLRRDLEVILGQLRAPSLGSLAFVLSQKAAEFSRRAQIPCLFLNGALEPQLHETELREFAKIVDEALSNIMQHARATQVQLQLEVDERCFVLSISDDGVGVANKGSAGMGLDNMQQRAKGLPSGQLTISSRALIDGKSGTRIELRWQRTAY